MRVYLYVYMCVSVRKSLGIDCQNKSGLPKQTSSLFQNFAPTAVGLPNGGRTASAWAEGFGSRPRIQSIGEGGDGDQILDAAIAVAYRLLNIPTRPPLSSAGLLVERGCGRWYENPQTYGR